MKYAAFFPKEQLPPILLENHTDWPWIFKHIPRRFTSWLGNPPVKRFGSAEEYFFYYVAKFPNVWVRSFKPVSESKAFLHPKPIPDSGWWIGIAPPYFAARVGRWHFRIGFRWDDIDCYYALSIALKK